VPFALALFATLIVQAILGMLTVTWQLKPLIVTLHLLFGMATLGLLWWLMLSLPRSSWGAAALKSARRAISGGGASPIATARQLALAGLAALAVQTALGGWTSSNYAAVACLDFPTCQGAWWPHGDYRNAFVLWRGLNIDYEGGVLDNPARTAIHVTHRLGALLTAVTLTLAALFVLRRRGLWGARLRAWAVLGALGLQLLIGISMVLKAFPLWLATAHTAGAALLLLATLALLRSLSAR
jgi:cytochrome c oxidase assembly protein subunit 15